MSRHRYSHAKRFEHHSSVIEGRVRRRPNIKKRLGYGPGLEVLENRTMLSVSAKVTGADVDFTSRFTTDSVYLRTASSQVEWSTDGTTWSSSDSSGTSLPKVAAGVSNDFKFDMSGGVYITGFTGAGGGLTFEGGSTTLGEFIGPSDVTIQGNVSSQGGDLTINHVQGVDVGSGLSVSTRDISAADLAANKFTGNSVGNSGALSMKVNNTDVLNPILYVNFNAPHIEIGSGASMLADASSGFTAGAVTMDVTNINYSLQTQLFTLFQGMSRNAEISVDSGATIEGETVSLDADAGDFDPLLLLPGVDVGTHNGLQLGLDSLLALLNPLTLPVSAILRDATAKVTIGDSASIDAVGTVDLESNASTDAGANADFVDNTRLEISLAFSLAQSDAETVVDPGATITAGGNVTVQSLGNSVAASTAETLSTAGGSSANAVQIAGVVAVTNATSLATVSQGATITSTHGNINVIAEGGNDNNSSVRVKSNASGTAGISFGVGDSTTDIVAMVNGTLNAAGAPVGTLSTIDPFTQIDWGLTNSIISFGSPPDFGDGEEIHYSSGNDGSIPGLQSGSNYYIINVPARPDEIQLASSYQDALNGIPIVFGSYPYLTVSLSGVPVNVPITAVDQTNNAIEYSDPIPGFGTAGQTVVYHAAAGQAIANLVDGATYTLQPLAANLAAGVPANEYQLFSANTLVPIYTDPTFTGLQMNLPATLDSSANTLAFSFNTGFTTGSELIYEGATDTNNNSVSISNLAVGQVYWVLPDPSDSTGESFKLSSTPGGTPIAIAAGATSINFNFVPVFSVDAIDNTVGVGFNIANVPGIATYGMPVTYHGALGANFTGLSDGTTYYAVTNPYDPQNLYLTASYSDSAAAYAAGTTAYTTAYNNDYNSYIAAGDTPDQATAAAGTDATSLGALWSTAGITAATDGTPPPAGPYPVSVTQNSDTGNDELVFNFATGVQLGQAFWYEGPVSGEPAVTGLVSYTTYYAIPDASNPDAFALATSPQNAFLANSNPSSLPALTLALDGSTSINLGPPPPAMTAAALEAPPSGTALPAGSTGFVFAADSDQGWRTGDQIVFGGATDTSGNSIVVSSVDPNGVAGTLQTGMVYYAVVDPSNPNTVELAATLQEADNNEPLVLSADTAQVLVNLLAPVGADQSAFPAVLTAVIVPFGDADLAVMTGTVHTLTPLVAAGVSVQATLESTEEIDASARPGTVVTKYAAKGPSAFGPVLYNKVTKFFNKLGNKSPSANASNAAGNQSPNSNVQQTPGGTGSSPSWSAAGCFVVNVGSFVVNADVGSTAVINSGGNVQVSASMNDLVQTASTATLTLNPMSQSKVAAALAVNVSSISPTVTATIASGARVNSSGTVSVTANLTYPFTFPTSLLSTWQGVEFGAHLFKGFLLDNTLGIQTALFNDWTEAASLSGPPSSAGGAGGGSTPGGAQYGLGGAVDIHYWDNDVEATIGAALINQDTSYDSTGQSVKVSATTTWDDVGVAGIFDLFAGPVGLFTHSNTGSSSGAQGSKGGIGATVNVNIMSNTTLAQIQSGAEIHTGSGGVLQVMANQNIFDLSLNQSGASAGDVGFSGTVAWNNIVSSTIAQIQDGVFVNSGSDRPGGAVTVSATDTMIVLSIAGGVAKSTHEGFGFTLAVNNIDRTTLALLGSNPLTNGGATPRAGEFNVASLDVEAMETGIVLGVTFAAASSTAAPPAPPSELSVDPVASVDNLDSFRGRSSAVVAAPAGKSGVGAAGAVSVIVMQSNTQAVIDDTGTFAVGGQVTVKATSNTIVDSIAGALGQSEQKTGGNTGFGGAFAVNVLSIVTYAYIYEANITADALTVSAVDADGIGSFTAGGAGASPGVGSSTAVAGSVSFNLVLPDTEAYLSNTTIALVGDSSVSAQDDSLIWSIAGAVALGGTAGYGVSISVNMIGSPTSDGAPVNPDLIANQPGDLPVEDGATYAFITDSTITMVGGTLSVTATSMGPIGSTRIVAITGSLGAGEKPNSTAAAGTLSVNLIRDDTEAYLSANSSVTEVAAGSGVADPGHLSLVVSASDTSGIVSLAGAVGIGQKSVGAALGYNQITSTIAADIEGSTVTLTGSVNVTAGSDQTIGGVVIGVAAGDGTGWAAAGSVGVNIISNTIDAHIAQDSDVTAGGPVALSATDQSLIVAIAGGVAVSLGGKAGGASIGYNRISNAITAYIHGSTVHSSGSVSLSATSSPLLVAVGAEGAGSGTSVAGAGTLTINSIANTVDAHIIASTVTAPFGDVTVNSSEAASEYVVALGIAGTAGGSAIGASIAYNYLGGLSPLDPNVLSYSDGILPGSTTVSVTADKPIPVHTEIDLPNHGFSTRDAVVYHAGGGTPIGGLVDGQTYYVIVIDPDHIQLASTRANATAGIAIPISSTGSTGSSQNFTLTKLQSTPAVTFNPTNSSISGNEIYLFSVTQSSGTLGLTYNVPLPGSAPNIDVSGSASSALFGSSPATTSSSITGSSAAGDLTTINSSNDNLTVTVNGTQLPTITLAPGTYTPTALAAELQKELNGAIFTQDGLSSGEELVYDNAGGTSIDGLTEGASYYITKAPDNGIELAASQSGALSAPAVPVTVGPNLGSGTGHTLTPLMASPAVTFGPSAVNAVITGYNEVSFANDPGLYTGESVTYHTNGGARIVGLTDGTTYYVISVDATDIELDPSLDDATSEFPTEIINLTTPTGAGTFTVGALTGAPTSNVTAYIDSSLVTAGGRVLVLSGFNHPTTLPDATTLNINPSSDVTVSGDAIHFASPDGLTTGQEVVYQNGTGSSIGGLTDGHSYYVIVLDPYTIKLAATYDNAVSGTPVQAGVTGVDPSTNEITLSSGNLGLYTGQAVVYNVGNGTAIGGLSDGTTYYVINVDATHIMLAGSLNDANNNNPITLTSAGTGTFLVPTSSTPIPLSSTGTGSSQTITPLDTAASASFNPSSQGVTLPGSTVLVVTVAVTQNLGTLTITSNDAQFQVTGGDAETGLLGTAPTTSGDAITGSAAAKLTITAGSNDTMHLTVNGTAVTAILKPGKYTADALATEVQTEINKAITSAIPSVTSAITFASPHGLTTGQEVVYHSNGAMTVTQNNGTLILDSNGPAIQIGGDAASSLFGTLSTTSSSGNVITGSSAANLTIGAGNDTLTLTVSSTPLTITLTHGTYTAAALAALLQQDINDVPALKALYDIGGLTDGIAYFVIKVNDYTIQLASSLANAMAAAPTAITLTSVGSGNGQSFTPTVPTSALTFGASAVATTNPSADEISFASSPSLATGDAVFYENGGGTSIGGLTDGQTYYVIAVDATHIKLAGTFNDAVNNRPVSLTSPGTGSNQSLVVKPTGFDLAGVMVPLPIPIGGQLVSVTAAGAGGTSKAGAGAVNLNFVRMNVDAHISNNSNVQATGDVDVESSDTSEIGSGTASVAISVGGGLAVNASVGLNDISNSVKAYVEGSTVGSDGAVNITATETAEDINVVVGGAGSGSGSAFGGSFAINYITNTVDAHIAASGGVGNGGTPSSVTAAGPLSVLATDTASIATLAGNIGASLGGSAAGAAAVAVNNVNDTDTATIDDSTASSGGAITVNATFAKPTALPPGLDVQIAAMAVSGAGAGTGAFAGSLSLNWVDNTVEAKVSNIAAPQFILAGGELSVIAGDHSTIDSLAGAVAIVGIGASGSSVAVGASVSFNYLGGDPSNPTSTNNNVVRAAIENVSGSLKASQIDVSATYTGQIDNITVAGSAAVGSGLVNVSLGGAVSINIIRNTSDAHISGSSNVSTTAAGADSLDVTAVDTSTIRALAGGVGIAVGTGTVGLAAGVSVAVNAIGNTTLAYVDTSHVNSAGDVNITATGSPTIEAITIGVAVAVNASGEGGVAGSGAGAGSGDTVQNTVLAYINNSGVSSSAGAIAVSATDKPTIQTVAGALGLGVAVGLFGAGASVGISVATNDVQDNDWAYINNSTVTASGHDVTLTAIETATIDAWTIGGAVGVGISEGFLGVGVAAAGAGSGNTVSNNVYAYIAGNSTVTTNDSGDVIVTATDSSSIEAIAGGLGVGVGVGVGDLGGAGLGVSLGVAAANNDIENTVKAYVDSSTVTSAGMVKVAATEKASILSVAIGGAISLGLGVGELVGVGIGVAVAGSVSSSTIADNIDAYVSGGSKVTAQAGSVAINATDNSSITAGAGGIAAAVGIGAGLIAGGLAVAAGFAVATNNIQNSVLAYVDHSTVSATGHSVTLAALEMATMTAVTVGGAVSIAVGAGIGVALAVAVGVGYSSNTLDNTVEAYLANGASVTTTNSGDVTLTATDSPNLTAITVGASVGASASLAAVTVTASAAVASNDVEDTIEAFSDSSTITSAGQITASATMPATTLIQATSVAASVAVAVAPIGAAFSGAGASSTNTVNDTISSYIQGTSASAVSRITATGNITLDAAENAPITSEVGAGAGAGAVVGGSIGVSTADNTVSSSIAAYVDNATVTSSGGQISIGASSSDTVNTLSVATAVAAALGAGGAGANATADVSPSVAAYAGSGATLGAGGNISITATATNSATAMTFGIAAAGALAIGTSTTTVSANGSTLAHIDGVVTGGASLMVLATATDRSDAEATAAAGGIVSGEGAGATATTSPTVMAAVNGNTAITATGTVQLTAGATPYANADTFGVAAGGLAVGASVSTATASPQVTATAGGSGTTITAGTLNVDAATYVPGSNNSVSSSGLPALPGALIGISATTSTANDTGTVTSSIADQTALFIANEIDVQANGNTDQYAAATGIAVGIVAIGSNTSTAESTAQTNATLGSGVTVSAGDPIGGLTDGQIYYVVPDSSNPDLISLASSFQNAVQSSGGPFPQPGSGAITISLQLPAFSAGSQSLTPYNGVGAAPITFNPATDVNPGTGTINLGSNSLYLGEPVVYHKSNGPALAISANGDDINFADAVSGSGGLVAGSAASSNTSTGGGASASIADNTGPGTSLQVSSLTITALHTAEFDSQTSTIQADALGFSGSAASNTDSSTVNAHIGNYTQVVTQNLQVLATNTTLKDLVPAGQKQRELPGRAA